MTNTTRQFRVIFKSETINGLTDFGTIWYDVNFFDAENIIKKHEHKQGFEVLTKSITKDSNDFKAARNLKFNN